MILDPVLDLFRGKAVTIPPLDGAFRPNARLDDAPAVAELTEPDNLLISSDRLLASSMAYLATFERFPAIARSGFSVSPKRPCEIRPLFPAILIGI